MAEKSVTTTSDLCHWCGEPIADRAATSFCAPCEKKLLSHLPSNQGTEEEDEETIETDRGYDERGNQ